MGKLPSSCFGSIEAVNGFFPQDFRHFFEGGFLLAAQEKGGVAVADYGIGKMKDAFEKGFKEATKTWGKKLPDISQNTRDAVLKKFDDYFAGKNS